MRTFLTGIHPPPLGKYFKKLSPTCYYTYKALHLVQCPQHITDVYTGVSAAAKLHFLLWAGVKTTSLRIGGFYF